MMDRRAWLAGAAGMLACPAGAAADSLRGRAAARGLVYGAAAASYELKDTDFTAALLADAAILVPEYEMKRHVVEPSPEAYDFSGADMLAGFARAHGLGLRGHPLVWHEANPAWLEPRVRESRDEKLLTSYVGALMRRYRGRVTSWDVVNEAIEPAHGLADGMRRSFWRDAFGPRFADLAFHAARAADPGAELVYNDWACDGADASSPAARKATLAFLDGLLKRGVPVDAFGMQGHMSAFGPRLDQRALAAFLAEIEARGLRILVTEHDVDDSGGPSDIGARDAAVAEASARFLDVALDNKAVRTVLSWGLSDRYLDPPTDWRLRLEGWTYRKLPLDSRMRRKPMWNAMARAFSGS